jgi:hypothetical protein
MGEYTAEAIVIHCIDFRFQPFIDRWLNDRFGSGRFDRVSLAGGVHDIETILEQIQLAHGLHRVKTVALINHEDCGKYGHEGSLERHRSDLKETERRIKALLPDLAVECYYLRLDGTFERVP